MTMPAPVAPAPATPSVRVTIGRVDIRAISGGLMTTKFPYFVKDASGWVRIEKAENGIHVILEDLLVRKEGGSVRCDGDIWSGPAHEPDDIDLRFQGQNFPIDEALVDALPPFVVPIVRRFSPRGHGDARVRVSGRLMPPPPSEPARCAGRRGSRW